MRLLLSFSLALTVSLTSLSACASDMSDLTNTERAILAQVDEGLDADRSLLKQIVNINSGTMNFAGVKAVADVLVPEFTALGFDAEWLDGAAFNRAGHLVASYGTKGPRLLLIGHLDTVFADDDSFQLWSEQSGNMVGGPGITDMKGGNVIMLSALRAMKNAGVLDRIQVRVVMTGDEENSGKPLGLSKKALIDGAKWADIALGFEDGDGSIETAVVARRSSTGWALEVTGKPAHSSQIFREDIGFGANFELVRILNEFREELGGIENLTFNPGVIAGGTRQDFNRQEATSTVFGKSNVIAQTAMARGGIRALSPEQLEMAKEAMFEIASRSLPHTSAVLTFEEGYPPMAPTDGNYALLGLYSQASRDLGFGAVAAVNPRKAGAADISFAANHVDMALDGLGLMGDGGHTRGEVADMDSFDKNIKKAAILMYRLSMVPAPL